MIRFSGETFKEKLLMERVEKACFKHLGQEDFFVTEICVISPEDIRNLNRIERAVDAVTDVLSFPAFERKNLPVSREDFNDCDYDGHRVILGSIMICRERAEEQAKEYGHSYERELGFLTCHGFLHLLGFDHMVEEDEEVMFEHQRQIMAAAHLYR